MLPKALVSVGGKPLLFYAVEKLKRAGIRSVVINVHHFADSIIEYVRDQDSFGMEVNISDEREELLETGGGILHARPFLEGEPFLVHNVDILSDLDLRSFSSVHRPGALATLLVSERETRRYLLFDDDMRLVGWTNIATGEVRSPYPGLDLSSCRRYAFSGIHLVSGEIFKVFDSDGWSGCFPIMDFYLSVCGRHPIYGARARDLHLVDVGKVEALPEAEHFLEKYQPF